MWLSAVAAVVMLAGPAVAEDAVSGGKVSSPIIVGTKAAPAMTWWSS